MDIQNDFLGRGWSFPPAFHKAGASPIMATGIEDIAQSLEILLNTLPGERVLHPRYGCRLQDAVFEGIGDGILSLISSLIRKSILHNEPRVIFLRAELDGRDDLAGILNIRVHFEVISTNTRHNIVFPYYFLEGTQLSEKYLSLPEYNG